MSSPQQPAVLHPHRMRWVTIMYLAQGLPFAIVNTLFSAYLGFHGVSLRTQGFARLLQLPWTLKVLWSPWVDRLGTPQRWIGASLLGAALALLLAGTAAATGGLAWGLPLAALLLTISLCSATQDVAIDGYFVRLLAPSEVGIGNGIRVGAYRVAMIIGGGAAVVAAKYLGWAGIFFLLAALLLLLAGVLSRAPAVSRVAQHSWRDWALSLATWLRQPGAWHAFAFILLYKLGDVSLGPMIQPFWIARGMSMVEIGFASSTLGIGASILGAMAGGWYTGRVGVWAALWQLGIAQALSNLGYAAVAAWTTGKLALFVASLLEHFTGGLGSAAELVLLTRLCDREHAATQYAALTCLFALTRILVGSQSGIGAERLGFANFFFLTFLLSFVAFAFLPGVRRRLQVAEAAAAG